MSKLYNLGCSVSYGNCASELNTLIDEHKSTSTYIADYNNLKEVNYASPGAGIDTVVRRLMTYDFEDGIYMVGLSHPARFQYVSTREKRYRTKRKAFSRGPELPRDNFETRKWNDIDFKYYDMEEQLAYHSFKNILLIQKLLQGKKYFMYNTINGIMNYKPKNWEVKKLKEQIDTIYYYQPEYSLFEFTLTNKEYQVADEDQHTNHIGMVTYAKELQEWIKDRKII